MQETLPCIRYYAEDYGVQQFREIPRNTAKYSVKGWVNLTEGMRCP